MKYKEKDIVVSDSWDHEDALEKAIAERDALLKKRPELQKFQKVIDESLEGVEKFDDRMKILGKMIGSSLDHLYNECRTLDELCNEIGIETNIPILELKVNSASPLLPGTKKSKNDE